jgi:hypothetical protein
MRKNLLFSIRSDLARALRSWAGASHGTANVSEPDDRSEIETRLRSYVAAHPGAADTVRGIVSFWLALPLTPGNLSEAGRVLQALRREGVIARRPLPEGALWVVGPPRE